MNKLMSNNLTEEERERIFLATEGGHFVHGWNPLWEAVAQIKRQSALDMLEEMTREVIAGRWKTGDSLINILNTKRAELKEELS